MMNDDFTRLNAGNGGDAMDETGIDFASAPFRRKRPRVVLTGEAIGEIAAVSTSTPTGTEYGLITRPIIEYPGVPLVLYAEVGSVAANVETVVTSYTVPAGKTFLFTGIVACGDVTGLYKVYFQSSPKFAGRTTLGEPTLKLTFPIAPLVATAGQTVEVRFRHYSAGLLAALEGSILGYVR